MNNNNYRPEFATPANDFSAKWYVLEAHYNSTVPVPLDTARERLEAAFEKGVKKNIDSATSYSGSFADDCIDASFSIEDSKGKTKFLVHGRLTNNTGATEIEMLIKEDMSPFPPATWIFVITAFLGLGCYLQSFPLPACFFIIITMLCVTKWICIAKTGSIANKITQMATAGHSTAYTKPALAPRRKEPVSAAFCSPDKPAKKSKITKDRIGILVFLTVWAAFFFIIPGEPSVSDMIYTKCTVTRSEGYEGGARFWISYQFDNRTYNIRMFTPLGKNHVGSQVFIKLDRWHPDIPHFLQTEAVPDCLLKIQPPPEGWEKTPVCK